MSFAGAGKDPVEVWSITSSNVEKLPANGNFNADSLYLVYKKASNSIHMWYGNVKLDLASADAKAWQSKASELNAAAGGNNSIFSEVEGFESNLFMSCFTKSGLFYLTKADSPSGHRLLQVKGKGGKRTKHLEMSSAYFASLRDVFILDGVEKIYIQAGPRASLYDRVAASNIATEMNATRGDKAQIIYMFEDAMNEGFWSHFQAKAAVPAIVSIGHEYPNPPSASSGPKLLKVGGTGPFQYTEVEKNVISKKNLAASGVFLIVGGGGEIVKRTVFVWVGSSAPADAKKNAATIAYDYIKAQNFSVFTPVQVQVEGKELSALADQFIDWEDRFPMVHFADALGLTAIKVPRKNLDNKAKAVNTDVDEGGKVRVWRVEGITRVTMNKAICGQFYSNNCYILLYAYTPPGASEKYVLIYWLGKNSSKDDRGSAAILTKYIADSLEGKKLVIRVYEGQEPHYLRRLFRGSLMVHNAAAEEAAPKKRNSLLANFSAKSKEQNGVNAVDQLSRMLQNTKVKTGVAPAELYVYLGSSALTLWSVQQPLAVSSLNNVDCFVLFSAKHVFVRIAPGTTLFVKEAIVRLAETKVREVDNKLDALTIVFDAGKEPEDFWTKIGGKGTVDAAKPTYFKKHSTRAPRLYHATARSGSFKVSEIESFKRKDLYDDEVFLLDTYSFIIAWVGTAVSTQENDLAADYGTRLHEAQAQIDGRNPDSVLLIVHSGEEMQLFTDYFLDWDKLDEETIEAEEISQILATQVAAEEEAARKAAEAAEKAAEEAARKAGQMSAQEEAERKRAAQVSEMQKKSVASEMSELEKVKTPPPSAVKAAAKPLAKVPAKDSGTAKALSKWGEFKQDFSYEDRFVKFDPSKRFDYSTLKSNYEDLKASGKELNPTKKEGYLDDKIFEELFGCTKAEFDAMPLWKRNEKKKKVGLF